MADELYLYLVSFLDFSAFEFGSYLVKLQIELDLLIQLDLEFQIFVSVIHGTWYAG